MSLNCDLSGFVSQCWRKYDYTIIKGKRSVSHIRQVLNFDDYITVICRSTHFHIRNKGKVRNLLSYDACSTIIDALISCRLDYCNYIMYNVPRRKNGSITKTSESMCAHLDTIAT